MLNKILVHGKATTKPSTTKVIVSGSEALRAEYLLNIKNSGPIEESILCYCYGAAAEWAIKNIDPGTEIIVSGRITNSLGDKEGDSTYILVYLQYFSVSSLVNEVVLHGRLVRDPMIETVQINGADRLVSKYRIAVNRDSDNKKADFVNCTAFDLSAKRAVENAKKGQEIVVTGILKTSSYSRSGTLKKSIGVIVGLQYFITK